MAKETKVIHVHLIFKKTSRFFGSISAIYSEFTAEEIGITEETLRHKGLSDRFFSSEGNTIRQPLVA